MVMSAILGLISLGSAIAIKVDLGKNIEHFTYLTLTMPLDDPILHSLCWLVVS
jgi:hypothetical protein